MFDGNFRTGVDRRTKPVGQFLVRMNVTADVLTVIGVLFAVACAVAIGTGHLMLGVVLLVAAAVPDLLDGAVAKAAGTNSVRGEFFDSVSDRVTDSLIFGGIGWYLASTEGGTIVMLPFALLGLSQLISYQRAKAEIHGFSAKGGLMERAERIVVLCVGLAISSLLVPVLWVMTALTALTAVQRFAKVWKQATAASPVLAARAKETKPHGRSLFVSWNESDERKRRSWRERMEEQRQSRRRARSSN